MENITFGTALSISILGILIVFMVLVLLMVIIIIMSKVLGKKKAAAAPSAAAPVPVPAADPVPAPGSCGALKLNGVSPRKAAMVMAIVADQLDTPINELRFISIKEVNDHEV